MFVDFHILNELGSPSINSNTFANRPPAGQIGRLFVSTDTFEIYRDNGTTWDLIGGPGSSTVTGTGAATQVAFWTAAQAIGGSNNLWWDNTNGYLGVKTNAPTAGVHVVQTDGQAILSDFTTVAGTSTAVAIYGRNTTNSSGYVAVLEEKTPNSASGQYPIKIMHSLSSGTAAANMATGIHFSLPDDAGTERINQFSVDTVDPAAATYSNRYRFLLRQNGSAVTPVYFTGTGIGVFTGTPTSALDVHSTGVIAQLNSTGTTNNSYLAFQRNGSGVWRLGDNYNSGNNQFEIHNTVLTVDAVTINAATNKTSWQAQQTYTTGLARGNYFDYNLSVSAGGSFSSPNSISAVGATLDLTLAGNATIPSGARSGLDAYNTVSFTGTGTLTHSQGTQIRAYSNVTAGWAFAGSATGTITHLAGMRVLFPDNSGSAVTITNNYGLLINDQTANTGTVTYTNRWGIYQEGSSDLNYMAANLLLGSTTNSGERLQVTGNGLITSTTPTLTINSTTTTGTTIGNKGNRLLLISNSSTINNGGEIVFAANDINTFRWGAITGSIQNNTVGVGATGNISIATKTNNSDTNLTERLTVTAAGFVGIGTTTPNANFTVDSGEPRIRMNRAGVNQIIFNHDGTIGTIRTETSTPLVLGTNGTERARFTAGGNFLIGTTTDSGEKLVVNGNIKSNSSIYTESGTITINSGVTSTIFTFGNSFGNTQVYMLTAMQSSGNTSWRLSAIVIGGDLAASGAYNVLTIGNNNISASFSGADLQITNSGGNATIIWRLLRLI